MAQFTDDELIENYFFEIVNKGKYEDLKSFFESFSQNKNNLDQALYNVSKFGHSKCAEILLNKIINPNRNIFNRSFITAAEKGHTDIISFFLKDQRIDPSVDNDSAICLAASNNHTDIIKLLLKDKRVNPAAQGNIAIIYAHRKQYQDTIDILWTQKIVRNSFENSDQRIFEILKKEQLQKTIIEF